MQSDAIPFCKDYLLNHASTPVNALLNELGLFTCSEFPTPELLNEKVAEYQASWQGPTFKGQRLFKDDEQRYYETIISEDKVIPTRERSWHDLFNALIWLQFPKTKSLLNELHVADINRYGVNPRTARRNRITHFDECGVVLAVESPKGSDLPVVKQSARACREEFLYRLAQHEWKTVFIANREMWYTQVSPFIFGHANLEMMLNPFIGLTGKWLAVSVPYGFSQLDRWQQRAQLDEAMVARIKALDCFECAPLLKPLPLLGVPSWHHKQDETFYSNSDYFRPLRAGSKPTKQLPLWT